jgi:hypothetical protein
MSEVGLDRSRCELGKRTGDDPKTAKYTCAGCGTVVVGFGPWRNHMKRSKKHKLFGAPANAVQAAAPASKSAKFNRNPEQHLEHEQAVMPKSPPPKPPPQPAASPEPKLAQKPAASPEPKLAQNKLDLSADGNSSSFVASPHFAGARTGYVFKRDKLGVGYYLDGHGSKKPKRPAADSEGADKLSAGAKPKKASAPQSAENGADAKPGKRWLGAANANGKRQRKFF